MKVKTNVKAGDYCQNKTKCNHNQTTARSLKVKTNVKAGYDPPLLPARNLVQGALASRLASITLSTQDGLYFWDGRDYRRRRVTFEQFEDQVGPRVKKFAGARLVRVQMEWHGSKHG